MSWFSDALNGIFGKTQKTNQSSLTQSNTTTNRDPWAPAIPYLTSALQTGQNNFNQFGQLSPDEQNAANTYSSVLQLRQQNPVFGQAQDNASDILGGAYNPQLTKSTPTTANGVAPALVDYNMGTANPAKARASQGALDPTGALQTLLSGQSNNPYLHGMADAATQQQRQTYQDQADDANQNLTQSVLPAIRSGAVAAGGYGGSRQGIAEGTAIGQVAKQNQRNARDLAQSSGGYYANLAGNDYEAAQGRMATAADQLNQQAEQAKEFDATNSLMARELNAKADQSAQEFNANNNTATQQFNANNTNTQNEQALQQAGLVPQIFQQGLNLSDTAANQQNGDFDQLMSVLGLPRTTAQTAFSNYVNPLTAIAGLGGQSNGATNTNFNGTTTGTSRDSAFQIAQQLAALMAG